MNRVFRNVIRHSSKSNHICNNGKVKIYVILSNNMSTKLKDDSVDDIQKLLNKQYNQRALFITSLGAVVNASLAGSKGFLGYSIGSTALIADCFNSLGDLFSDAVVYYTVTEARKRATPEKPWGSGKIEPLGAFVVGGLLAITGLGVVYTAVYSMMDITSISAIFINHNPESLSSMTWIQLTPAQYAALGVSGVSVAVKEALFRYTLEAGQNANSHAVIANAWQHRSDVFVSCAVFAGLSGSYMGYPFLDPLAGLLVSGVILKQALTISQKSLRDLSDAPASKEETQALRNTCLRVPGIQSVVDLKARQSGPFIFVECTVGVDGDLSASAAHRLAELVRAELLRRHKGRVANAVVDVDPLGSTGLGERASHSSRSPEDITVEVKRALLEPWRSSWKTRFKKLEEVQNRLFHGPEVEESNTIPSLTTPPLPEDDDLNFNNLRHISSVSEVIVYYKDDGRIALKVDVCMNPDLTIKKAHKIAVLARRHLMEQIEGLCQVDVDLELEDSDDDWKMKTKPDRPTTLSPKSESALISSTAN